MDTSATPVQNENNRLANKYSTCPQAPKALISASGYEPMAFHSGNVMPSRGPVWVAIVNYMFLRSQDSNLLHSLKPWALMSDLIKLGLTHHASTTTALACNNQQDHAGLVSREETEANVKDAVLRLRFDQWSPTLLGFKDWHLVISMLLLQFDISLGLQPAQNLKGLFLAVGHIVAY